MNSNSYSSLIIFSICLQTHSYNINYLRSLTKFCNYKIFCYVMCVFCSVVIKFLHNIMSFVSQSNIRSFILSPISTNTSNKQFPSAFPAISMLFECPIIQFLFARCVLELPTVSFSSCFL